MTATRWTSAVLAAEPSAGRPGTEAPVSTWVYSRPVAFMPTEPTKRLNFLPLHLQPYTLTPNPDILTSHHRSAPQTGALVLKGLGRPQARGWLSAGRSSLWNQSSGVDDGRRLSGLWSSRLKDCPERVATAGYMQ